MKYIIALGLVLLGTSVTFARVAYVIHKEITAEQYESQFFVENNYIVGSFQNGSTTCYTVEKKQYGNTSIGISCVK